MTAAPAVLAVPNLLAMKARVSRAGDAADIVRLTDHLGLTSPDEVESVATEVFGEPLTDRQRLFVGDVLAAR